MRPYEVETINGREQRVPWSGSRANIMLDKFKREAISELSAIECKKAEAAGIGHLVKPSADGDMRLVPIEDVKVNGVDTFKVNPIALTLKCSGAESMDLTREKYAKFCAEPRNPGMVEDLPAYAKKAGVVSRISSPITSTPMTDEPPKRKRGRPRKSDKL